MAVIAKTSSCWYLLLIYNIMWSTHVFYKYQGHKLLLTFINYWSFGIVSALQPTCHGRDLDELADVGRVTVRKKLSASLKHERIEGGEGNEADCNVDFKILSKKKCQTWLYSYTVVTNRFWINVIIVIRYNLDVIKWSSCIINYNFNSTL